jgi:peptidyl-prolyl cis-trans isomerase A (cyclophilin A)
MSNIMYQYDTPQGYWRSFIGFATALLIALAMPLAAQEATSSPHDAQTSVEVAARPKTVNVALLTSLGTIIVAVEVERAPITAGNFLRYVDQKRFDGSNFYRAMKLAQPGAPPEAPRFGLIQGGTRGNLKRILPPIKHEPTTVTGLSHINGAISMARAAPGTASGDFFIVLGGLTGLDANPAARDDKLGYAVFGQIIAGMDVVLRILDVPVSTTAGVGVMKGQMIAAPVRILSARRAKRVD